MIKKILIAIDAGGPADSAVAAGLCLAKQLAAEVTLLHVVDVTLAFRPELGVSDDARVAELRRSGQRLLDQTIARCNGSTNVKRLLVEGEPAETIIAVAGELSADLIVIGSDSRGRLAHFLLGSTADSVIRRAPCPVVTVRDNPTQKPNAAAAHALANA